MFKSFLFCLLVSLPMLAWSQTVDSTAIRQVDSLIEISRGLIGKRNLNLALDANIAAEKIALEKLGRESEAYANCCNVHGIICYYQADYSETEKWWLEAKDVRDRVLGKAHPDYAVSLNNLALLYKAIGQYEKAEPLYLEAKDIREKTLGKQHHYYATSLNNLANLYAAMGQYEKAEPLYVESKNIREKALGKEHPDYASSLENLARLYKDIGQYEKAEPLYLEAKDIREKTLGKEHPDYATSLQNLAILYKAMGQFEKAELLYIEAKDIKWKTVGKEHPDYASVLNSLAILYNVMGQYEKAEPLYLEAKYIREKILGKEHSDYASSLLNLAGLYKAMGQYEKALSLYLESKNITKKVLSKEHPNYASVLNNLANLYKAMGQYEKAEPLYIEAKDIREKALGKQHHYYARSLNNLANLYAVMGQYEKAEPLYVESKNIREKALGKEHPDYATSLENLAGLYKDMGEYKKAEPLYIESRIIQEKALSKQHPDYAQCLYNIALLYTATGEYEKAEPFFIESNNIWEATLGKQHPYYAWSLDGLADLYCATGEYGKAEPLYIESKAIWETTLGQQHPYYAQSLDGLADLYYAIEQDQKAEQFYRELFQVNRQLIEKAILHLSEQELNNYLSLLSKRQDRTFSFTQSLRRGTLTSTCYDNSLFYKGILLQSSNRVERLALSDSAATDKLIRLKGYQRRLAAQYALPITERDSALVAQMETKSNDLEKDLTRTVAGFGEAMRQVQWQEVQAALQPGEAAVEFVHYRYYNPNTTDSTLYAALVLTPTAQTPAFIPLFEEKQLSALISDPGVRSPHDAVNQLYASKLYDLIWAPLNSVLADYQTVYYAPSGLLHRISLPAIPVDTSQRLSDAWDLQYVSSTRNLVVKPGRENTDMTSALVFGGLRYDADTTGLQEGVASRGEQHFASGLALVPEDSLTRGRVWQYLPKTEEERKRLNRLFEKKGVKASSYAGLDGTEEAFKKLGEVTASPDILHLATHGFFFPDKEISKEDRMRELSYGGQSTFRFADNPMLRSGLILSGANLAWKDKVSLPDREDGILTAYEISQMNLSSTRLVVLSACQTGLGDIQGSEGVYGLQRAFKLAGADYLLMTLWSIPDTDETVDFMETFYKHLLEDKMPVREAFNTTQREMRALNPDPYYWAGFVLVE